jgi:hypothetical protein
MLLHERFENIEPWTVGRFELKLPGCFTGNGKQVVSIFRMSPLPNFI